MCAPVPFVSVSKIHVFATPLNLATSRALLTRLRSAAAGARRAARRTAGYRPGERAERERDHRLAPTTDSIGTTTIQPWVEA